jgi:hypothetical protein
MSFANATPGYYEYSIDTVLGRLLLDTPSAMQFRSFPLSDSSPSMPLLPGAVDPVTGAMTFDFVASLNNTVWIDPVITTGYDYAVTLGPNMTSALFPELGDPDGYEVYALNPGGSLGGLLGIATGNTLFNFGAGGVSAFALRDIETSLMLDPANTTAFVTGLTFDVAGNTGISMTQTPVTTFVPDSNGAIPEPSVWALMLAGFAAIGASLRGGKRHILAVT